VELVETIRALPGERGLVREFSTNRFWGKPLFFSVKSVPGIRCESSAGKFQNGILKVPGGVMNFSVTMKRTDDAPPEKSAAKASAP